MNRGRTCGRGPRPAGCREWLGWELPDHLGGSHGPRRCHTVRCDHVVSFIQTPLLTPVCTVEDARRCAL